MSVLRVSSSSFRKTLNISYRKKNLIFLLSRTLPFACILSVHCDYNPTNHYHVLIDVSEFSADFLKQTKPCSVPCLFTTFKYLFSSSDTLEAKGDVFQKFLLAMEFNKSNFNGFSKADTTASIQKRLPIFTKNVTNKFQQPDCLYRNIAGHKS